jgi:hypothetical protein
MTYKGMLLSALLVPISTIYSIQDLDLHLQNLNDRQLAKLQELSDLSVKIAEKQALIESWDEQMRTLAGESEESYKELDASLDSFSSNFERAFCEDKDVKTLLTGNFSVANKYEFDFIKVFLVRRYFERVLIVNLVARYEKCLQELVEMIG